MRNQKYNPFVYGNFICERKITILLCILKFQSRPDHRLLYLYNIKHDKVWTPKVTLTLMVETQVLFATHRTFIVISYVTKNSYPFMYSEVSKQTRPPSIFIQYKKLQVNNPNFICDTTIVISYIKEKKKILSCYTVSKWTIYLYKAGRMDWQTGRRTVWFQYATLRGHEK
jgi:hypothetical protein